METPKKKLQDLLKAMVERKKYLVLEAKNIKEEGYSFDPKERNQELNIWLLEVKKLISSL